MSPFKSHTMMQLSFGVRPILITMLLSTSSSPEALTANIVFFFKSSVDI